MLRFAGFQKFATWLSLLDGGTAATPAPPPTGNAIEWGAANGMEWGAANEMQWGS